MRSFTLPVSWIREGSIIEGRSRWLGLGWVGSARVELGGVLKAGYSRGRKRKTCQAMKCPGGEALITRKGEWTADTSSISHQ